MTKCKFKCKCKLELQQAFALNENRCIVKYYFNLHYLLCFLCCQSFIFSESCLMTLMFPLTTYSIHRTFPLHTRFCINTVHTMALQHYHCIQFEAISVCMPILASYFVSSYIGCPKFRDSTIFKFMYVSKPGLKTEE